MATGNGLIAAVAAELNRTDLDVGGTQVTVSQTALNDALRHLFNRYPFSWRVVDPPLPVTTVAGTSVYDTSAAAYGSIKVHDIYGVVLDTGDLQTRPMTEIPHQQFLRQWANLAYLPQDKPTIYARREQYKIVVAPRPDASTYTLRVFYSLEFVDITTFTADLTQVPQRAIEMVKIGMLARLYRWMQDDDRAIKLYALLEEEEQSMIREDKANPNLSFLMQPMSMGWPLTVNYWQSPFITGVP